MASSANGCAALFGIDPVVSSLCRGRTPEEKKVIKYFLRGGCTGALGNMQDEEYTQMIMAKLNSFNIKERALNKIGLDEDQLKEIPPVFLHGYKFQTDREIDNFEKDLMSGSYSGAIPKITYDGRLVSSKYIAAFLFFSDTHVYMYSYTWDLAFGTSKEQSEEYFYKDITNFTAVDDNAKIVDMRGCSLQRKFQSKTYSNFKIIVPGAVFECSTTGVPNADQAVQAMRAKLREKKQG